MMLARGLTIHAVALACGVDYSTVAWCKTHERKAPDQTMKAIVEAVCREREVWDDPFIRNDRGQLFRGTDNAMAEVRAEIYQRCVDAGYSVSEIARILVGRGHTGVLESLSKRKAA